MTISQWRALYPLLTAAAEALKTWPLDQFADSDGLSPGVHLTLREWRRIIEEFGTE